jgi:hypothetical protein
MKDERSLIPISKNELTKSANSIAITQRLLATSKYEFYNDFKGEKVWEYKMTNYITSESSPEN